MHHTRKSARTSKMIRQIRVKLKMNHLELRIFMMLNSDWQISIVRVAMQGFEGLESPLKKINFTTKSRNVVSTSGDQNDIRYTEHILHKYPGTLRCVNDLIFPSTYRLKREPNPYPFSANYYSCTQFDMKKSSETER